MIPLEAIDYSEATNGRFGKDEDHVQRLAASIRSTGLINPISVRNTPDGYQIIAGRNRVDAAHLLGWTKIAACVQQADDLQAGTARLAENVARSNLSPVEEAVQLNYLVDNHPNGVDGVAIDLGRNTQWILDRLDLLNYPDTILTHIHAKKLSLAVAKKLALIEPKDLRDVRIEQAVHHGITAATAALWLQDARATAAPEFDLPENTIRPVATSYQTETTSICIRCDNRHSTAQMIPTHICHTCFSAMITFDAPADP